MPAPKPQHKLEKPQVKDAGQAEYLLGIVKPTTKTVKIFPFFYTAILLIFSSLDTLFTLKWAQLFWLLFFTSVPSACLCLLLSRHLKLCPWYRVQCFVILAPLATPICRIFSPDINILWIRIGVALIFILSLINCYFTIIKPSVRPKK